MNPNFHIELIIKSFQEKLSEQENEQLQNWLSIDSQNQLTFDELKKTWTNANDYKTNINVNTNTAWQKVAAKTTQQKAPTKTVSIFSKKWAQAAAAVLVIVFGTTVFFNLFSENNTTIITAENEVKEVVLPDGSSVWLNENSALTYDNKFAVRDVQLEGEAFFDVTHNPENPFTVFSGETQTKVLGTTFNVNTNEEATISVSLYTGKIAFNASNNDEIILAPGETATYNEAQNTSSRTTTKDNNLLAWKTNILTFEKTSVNNVVDALENYYGKDIELYIKNEQDCLFTGTFENNSLKETLDILTYTYNASYSIQDETYTLNITNCN